MSTRNAFVDREHKQLNPSSLIKMIAILLPSEIIMIINLTDFANSNC